MGIVANILPNPRGKLREATAPIVIEGTHDKSVTADDNQLLALVADEAATVELGVLIDACSETLAEQ